MTTTWTAVLMAGGKSSRMGQDKAEVRWEGRCLWQHQLATLRELGPAHTVVTAGADVTWRPAGVEWVKDAAPGCGPLAGLAATLGMLRTTHAVVLAIDMPRMTAGYLLELMAQARPGVGVVPVNEGWGEPLAAVYPCEAREEAEATLLGQDKSLQCLLRRLQENGRMRPHAVASPDQTFFLNCNETGDLARG
jgi:molybdenum cofactor guanylyltransferase